MSTSDPTRTSLGGGEASVSVESQATAGWQYGFFISGRSPGFETNDLGFLSIADIINLTASVSFLQPQVQRGFLDRYRLFAEGRQTRQWSGETLSNRASIGAVVTTRNLVQLASECAIEDKKLDRFAFFDGPTIVGEKNVSCEGSIFTNSSRRLFGFFRSSGNATPREDSWQAGAATGAVWRPIDSWRLEMSVSATRGVNDRQPLPTLFMAFDEPRYIAARASGRTLSTPIRSSFAFNRKLSLDLYLEPFAATFDYSNYKELRDARASSYANRFQDFDDNSINDDNEIIEISDNDSVTLAFPRGDVTALSLQSNLVLRWQFRANYALTLAWTQSRFASQRSFSRRFYSEFSDSFTTPGSQIFYAKFTSWFGR